MTLPILTRDSVSTGVRLGCMTVPDSAIAALEILSGFTQFIAGSYLIVFTVVALFRVRWSGSRVGDHEGEHADLVAYISIAMRVVKEVTNLSSPLLEWVLTPKKYLKNSALLHEYISKVRAEISLEQLRGTVQALPHCTDAQPHEQSAASYWPMVAHYLCSGFSNEEQQYITVLAALHCEPPEPRWACCCCCAHLCNKLIDA